MKKIYLIAAIAAVLCGLLVFRYTSNLQRQVDAQIQDTPMTQVVVASQDIPAGTVITEEMVTLAGYPTEYVHSDAATTLEDVAGKVSSGDIVTGETILISTIGTPEEMSIGLAYEVPEGMRAISVTVDTWTGVSSFIKKGDHVDLIRYRSPKEGEDSGKSELLLEDVEVLAIGDVSQSSDGESNYVYTVLTLVLSPEDCLKLTTAMEEDTIVADLRQRTE